MKKCVECGLEKELSEFHNQPTMKDKKSKKCKTCYNKDCLEYRKKNVDRYRKHYRERSSLPHRKALSNRVGFAYRTQYPERHHANISVRDAIRKQILVRPDNCERCGLECRVEGHHHDYAKPLNVIWVCNSCHKIIHKQTRLQMQTS